MAFAPEPTSKAWESLTSSLGAAGAAMGQRLRASGGGPPLGGLVERVGESGDPHALLL